jgi:hypothetical protein
LSLIYLPTPLIITLLFWTLIYPFLLSPLLPL